MPRVTSKALPRARPAQSTIQPPQRESNACFTRHPFPRPKTSRMSPRRPKAALVLAERPDILGGMWDRYDPRDERDRHRAGSWDRPRGSRGGRSERDDDRVFDPRDVFVRAVDLPLGLERELARSRSDVPDQRHRQPRPRHGRRVSHRRGERPRADVRSSGLSSGQRETPRSGRPAESQPVGAGRTGHLPVEPRTRPAGSEPVGARRSPAGAWPGLLRGHQEAARAGT